MAPRKQINRTSKNGAAKGTTTSPNTKVGVPKRKGAIKKAPARKRGGKKKIEEKFMDDFLLDDELPEEEEGKAEHLNRSERYIPDIELRKRPVTKPANVPYQLWMAYCMMEEFIYRQSLTEEEVLASPLIDDVLLFRQGGPKPCSPPGFKWDEDGNLVPCVT